jgi:hypothetical protein
MHFITGLVVGSVIGFMFAWFWFSWLTVKGETEHYSQSSSSKDGDLTDASVQSQSGSSDAIKPKDVREGFAQ